MAKEKDDSVKTDKKKKVKNFKEFDPTQFIEVEPVIAEAAGGKIVVSWGRMNPITTGHEKLINAVINTAKKEKASPAVYLTHSQDKNKNPLSYDDKVKYAQKAFGSIIVKSKAKTIIELMKELARNYRDVIVVAGSDRVKEFETLLNKYNGKEYKFNSVTVVSAGSRDPDAEGVEGMSASKMRQFAADDDLNNFSKGLPKKLKSSARQVMTDVKKGMNESIQEDEDLQEKQPLSIQQRRKRGLQMKRFKTKIKIGRERSKRKMANKEKLMKRSRKKALEFIRNRLMKQKKYSEMSPTEKIALDKRVQKINPKVLDRIAKRLFPKVRAAEKERLRSVLNKKQEDTNEMFESFIAEKDTTSSKPQDPDVKDRPGSQPKGYYKGVAKDKKDARAAHFEKGAKMDDDNPDAYKPAPGDKEAKTKPSVHTKRFKDMFGEAAEGYCSDDCCGADVKAADCTCDPKCPHCDCNAKSIDEASIVDTKVRKRPHMALEKSGAVKIDKRFKMYKPKKELLLDKELTELVEDMNDFFHSDLIEELSTIIETQEYDDLMESDPSASLKKKAEKTGISYGILKKVFDRGVAAWRTGHRPGTNPTQWGHARVNSFATKGKGTWGKADKDLADKVRKEEVELDEAKTDIYHQHMLKALGKSRLPKNHQYTSMVANNGDFVVKDGGGRTAGRIAKGDHNLKEVELDEAPRRKGAPKMTGDSIAIQRAKDAEHAKAMGRSVKTGRKLPKKTMTSTQRSLASLRREEVEMDEAHDPKHVKMAVGIASDKRYAGGNMTGAVKQIDKIKKGLSNHPQVRAVLRKQNEELINKLDELTAAEKKLVNQMYDKKGNLTPLGKKVMNHGKKPGDKGYIESVEETITTPLSETPVNMRTMKLINRIKKSGVVKSGSMSKSGTTKENNNLSTKEENKIFTADENDILNKLLEKINSHVLDGEDCDKVIKEITSLGDFGWSARELKEQYTDRYEEGGNAEINAAFAAMYEKYVSEGALTDIAKKRIAREKARDKIKHTQMVARAKVKDLRQEDTPSDREWGTENLTDKYKKDTPGQND